MPALRTPPSKRASGWAFSDTREASAPPFEVLGKVAVEAASGALIAREWRGGAVDLRNGESGAVVVKDAEGRRLR